MIHLVYIRRKVTLAVFLGLAVFMINPTNSRSQENQAKDYSDLTAKLYPLGLAVIPIPYLLTNDGCSNPEDAAFRFGAFYLLAFSVPAHMVQGKPNDAVIYTLIKLPPLFAFLDGLTKYYENQKHFYGAEEHGIDIAKLQIGLGASLLAGISALEYAKLFFDHTPKVNDPNDKFPHFRIGGGVGPAYYQFYNKYYGVNYEIYGEYFFKRYFGIGLKWDQQYWPDNENDYDHFCSSILPYVKFTIPFEAIDFSFFMGIGEYFFFRNPRYHVFYGLGGDVGLKIIKNLRLGMGLRFPLLPSNGALCNSTELHDLQCAYYPRSFLVNVEGQF